MSEGIYVNADGLTILSMSTCSKLSSPSFVAECTFLCEENVCVMFYFGSGFLIDPKFLF